MKAWIASIAAALHRWASSAEVELHTAEHIIELPVLPPKIWSEPAPATLVELGIVSPAAPEPGETLQAADPSPEPTAKEPTMKLKVNSVTQYADRAEADVQTEGGSKATLVMTDRSFAASLQPGVTYDMLPTAPTPVPAEAAAA